MRDLLANDKESYMSSLLVKESTSKLMSRKFAQDLGLARISLSPAEGQLIKTLVLAHGAKRFLEIGTLTGLSAQYIFEALPQGGALWTLEKDPRHGEMARQVFAQLDQSQKQIHLILGDARVELEKLASLGPFDGVFIDGNKAAYGDYLRWAETHLRPGGLILADNVFLSGSVWGQAGDRHFSKKQIQVLRDFNQRLADPHVFEAAIVPSHEGLYVGIKK